jgi:hypothetical protein
MRFHNTKQRDEQKKNCSTDTSRYVTGPPQKRIISANVCFILLNTNIYHCAIPNSHALQRIQFHLLENGWINVYAKGAVIVTLDINHDADLHLLE